MDNHVYIRQNNKVYGYRCEDVGDGILMPKVFWQPSDPISHWQDVFGEDTWNEIPVIEGHLVDTSVAYSFEERFSPAVCLIDIDQKQLTLLDNLYLGLPMRRLGIRLMHQTWPGWRIRWADQGYAEISHLIGYPHADFRENYERLTSFEKGSVFYSTIGFVGYFPVETMNFEEPSNKKWLEEFLHDLESPEEVSSQPSCLITLKTSSFVHDYGFRHGYEGGYLFSIGSRIIPTLLKIEPIHITHEYAELETGLLIDLERHTVTFWRHSYVDPLLVKEMEKTWQGWRVFWHTGGLPYQFALSGRDPATVMQSFDELAKLFRYWLPYNSDRGWDSNPSSPDLCPDLDAADAMLETFRPYYPDIWKHAGQLPE